MDLDIISSVQDNITGHCLCVLGDSMAMPVSSMVNKFRDEFEEVISEAALSGFPTTDGRESQKDGGAFDGEEPGPGGVSPETTRQERLAGRPVPGEAQGVQH
jgi:hypothetical protein